MTTSHAQSQIVSFGNNNNNTDDTYEDFACEGFMIAIKYIYSLIYKNLFYKIVGVI